MGRCRHKHAVMLGRRRTSRVPNRRGGYMLYLDCLCPARGVGTIPMGPANDRGTRRDIRLAKQIGDLCVLWEPSAERTRWIDTLAAIAAGQWSKP
jgi:hypothetical protein